MLKLKKSQMLIYRTGFNVIKAKKNFWFKDDYYRNFIAQD